MSPSLIYACLECPVPSDNRGTCAQEVPSGTLACIRKAQNFSAILLLLTPLKLNIFLSACLLSWFEEGKREDLGIVREVGGEKAFKMVDLSKDKSEGLAFGQICSPEL